MKRKAVMKVTKKRIYFQYVVFSFLIAASFFWTLFDIGSGLISFGLSSHRDLTMRTIEDVGSQNEAVQPMKSSSSFFPPIPSALFLIGCAGFLYTERISSRAR